MDIQYYHKKQLDEFSDLLFHNGGRRFTAAVEVPAVKTFLDLFTKVDKSITLQVGIAVVHPKDEYVKSVGRLLAHTRLKPVELKLKHGTVNVSPDTGDYIYDAIFTDEARSIILELRYKEHYFRPILSSVSLTSEEIE